MYAAKILTPIAFWAAVILPSKAADADRHSRLPPIDVIPIGEYALFPTYMIGNPHCYLRHVEINDHGMLRIITEPVCN